MAPEFEAYSAAMISSNGNGNDGDRKLSKPNNAYNANASSMLGLLSEVSKHTESYKRGKQDPKDRATAGPSKDRKSKKPSLFDRSNRGIEARSARDKSHMLKREDLSVEARRVLESRERLEKKAELYERLARGENINGVTREQLRDGLLVDFEAKAMDEVYRARGQSSSEDDSDDDEDESKRAETNADAEDDVSYCDFFMLYSPMCANGCATLPYSLLRHKMSLGGPDGSEDQPWLVYRLKTETTLSIANPFSKAAKLSLVKILHWHPIQCQARQLITATSGISTCMSRLLKK